MPTATSSLLLALVAVTAVFFAVWVTAVREARRAGHRPRLRPTFVEAAIGFVTNFFDTLGIGSFATTTSLYKLRRVIADEKIPGTLNVGHTPPSVMEALIYISVVAVGFTTLASLIAASVAGAWFGAGIVSRLPRRKIQVGMGFALMAAATLMLVTQLRLVPGGGTALELSPAKLAVGVAVNLVLGALMTLGIGLYAPCMITVSLLGMDPTTAFPIMMGSCAFLMPVGGMRFIREHAYDLPAAIGLTAAGVPAVVVAAFIVRSMPLGAVRWLVVVVVVYAAIALLRSARGARVAQPRDSRSEQPAVGFDAGDV